MNPQASSVITAPTWLRSDRAEADADRSPQRDAARPPSSSCSDVAAAQHEGDAAPLMHQVADRPAERLADDAEHEARRAAPAITLARARASDPGVNRIVGRIVP
jgi:hypothetical protein